jgi:hypothetical protein
MKQLIYLICEGVLDSVLLTELLSRNSQFTRTRHRDNLPDYAGRYLDGFKWPHEGDISRFAVPAPIFLEAANQIVVIRNAEGIARIRKVIESDGEVFFRIGWNPSAVGVLLDSDDQIPEARFDEFASLMEEFEYPRPKNLDEVDHSASIVVGIFGFPGGSQPGTIENVLYPLAQERFPDLLIEGDSIVSRWKDREGRLYQEIRKPAGPLKAALSVVAAILKPAKPLAASIQDHRWVPDDLSKCPCLAPISRFLSAITQSAIR